jgi:hypothetical protein
MSNDSVALQAVGIPVVRYYYFQKVHMESESF